jgi:hypothetical protein
MIELGSNQAYYSVLFRSMLRHHGIQGKSLMVEPYDQFMPRSLRHIESYENIYEVIASEDNGQHGTDGLIYARLRE